MPRIWIVFLLVTVTSPVAQAATGRHGMVAAEHRLAASAGVEVLRAGGNAVDAAVATALTVGVVNPSSCGLGGGGFMILFDHASRQVRALDFRESAPAAARRDLFMRDGHVVPKLSLYGGLAVAVPGEVAGLLAAHKRYGRLPLTRVVAPAIHYARAGFPIESHLARAIARNRDRFRTHPRLAQLFLHGNGEPLREGERLLQPQLADTLEKIVDGGSNAFYAGPVADAMIASVRDAGGVMTRTDLAGYQPIWRQPVHGRFHGYDIYSMPPPSSGGGVLVEILNIIAGDDLRALGHGSPTYLHLLAEAMQFGFADRASAYGDPDFVAIPLRRLLSPARARRLRRRIHAARTFMPDYYGGKTVPPADAGTSHLSVIDADGNAVACTTTINTSFGSMLVAGDTGILLNNEMDDFSAHPGVPNVYGLVGTEANSIAAGKRPLSSMTPTIVLRNGTATVVAGASGGPVIISATLQALLNVLVFGENATTSVGAPRIHHQWRPATLRVEAGIEEGTRAALARLGHATTVATGLAAVQLVRRLPDGTLEGAADPRKGGKAVGW